MLYPFVKCHIAICCTKSISSSVKLMLVSLSINVVFDKYVLKLGLSLDASDSSVELAALTAAFLNNAVLLLSPCTYKLSNIQRTFA